MTALGVLVLTTWVYLIAFRGGFWRMREREDLDPAPAPARWPQVAVVIPARDEAETVGAAVGSLLAQDYPRDVPVFLVDDGSRDGTASVARAAAGAAGAAERLTVIAGAEPPPGWTGKVWALAQGVAAAEREASLELILLTDADILHDPGALRRMVARAEAVGAALVSTMVRLNCESLAERALIPAFVYFFQMLHPFSWTNRADRRTAAGAGGAMLVRAEALRRAGGLEAVRGALIDDCALARRMKAVGPARIALSGAVRSLRAYPTLAPIRRMVVRSAWEELRRSPLRLAAALGGLALTFLAPPALAIFGDGAAQAMGAAAFALMVMSFRPILRLYGLSWPWGLALPATAAAYAAFTAESAWRGLRGRGGAWKGRLQAAAGEAA